MNPDHTVLQYGYAIYTTHDLLSSGEQVASYATPPGGLVEDFLQRHPGWARDGQVFIVVPVVRDKCYNHSATHWRPCGSRRSRVVRWVVPPVPQGRAEVVDL